MSVGDRRQTYSGEVLHRSVLMIIDFIADHAEVHGACNDLAVVRRLIGLDGSGEDSETSVAGEVGHDTAQLDTQLAQQSITRLTGTGDLVRREGAA